MIIIDSNMFNPTPVSLNLMSGCRKVAEFHNNNMHILEPNLVPLYFMNNATIESWLSTRTIDTSRINSRKLKKVLGLHSLGAMSLADITYGACITDSYWVKHPSSRITYDKVRFKVNEFIETSLLGIFEDISDGNSTSPDLTTIGSMEKSWMHREDSWFLLKAETPKELFSELLTFRLGELLGFYMAKYKLSTKFYSVIESKDFTNNIFYNYEPMFNLVGEDDDYQTTIDELIRLEKVSGKPLVNSFLNIIFLDSLVANPDRHTFNYGILRDVDSGSI